jgi:hypothetical protein
MLAVMLLDDRTQFVSCHRACGQLTGDATEPEANGYMVTVACGCGVVFMRWVTPEEAMREMAMSDFVRTEVLQAVKNDARAAVASRCPRRGS